MYSYSNFASPLGTIKVTSHPDHNVKPTRSDTQVVGMGLVPLEDKEKVSQRFAIDNKEISNYEITVPNKTTSSILSHNSILDFRSYVLMIWSQ